MCLANSIASFPSAISTQVSQDTWFDAIDHVEMEETWFDAIDYVEMEETWFDVIDHVEMEETWVEGAEAFDTHEEHQADPSSSAGEAADSRVPFTEDCRRGVQQFVRTLGEYGESRMLSACLSKILPGTPVSLVIAANSLYTAVTEQRNIDTAAVHALGLASGYLPENINVVSQVASFIRDTVTGWTDETFLQQFLGNEENHTSIHLFTALAVTAFVAGRWMKDEGAPQRGVLKVPAFMANIFIRASHYWTALGNMAISLPSGAEIPENTGTSQHAPAFEVDTQVEMTGDVCDATVSGASAPRLTAFSSNSTASPEAYTRATVHNRPASAPGKNTHLSVSEQAHYLAVEKLRQESGLSDLLYCATRKTEARQQTNEKIITTTHFNTKCDATVYPELLMEGADSIPVHTDIPETQVADNPVAAAGRTTVSGNEMKHPVSENVEQSDNDNNLLSTLWNSISQTLSMTGEFMLQHDPLRFPEASALPAGGYQDKEINRFPRYAVSKQKTTTPPPVPDDVKIEKLDFSCIEERQNLSVSDVFRQIGKTLSNPVSELAKESQVIHYYYNNYNRCPTPEERTNLLSITSAVDKTISMITALLPGSQPLVITKGIGGPLFRMIADSIDNKQLNVDDLSEANDQLLALGKSIVDTSPKNSKGQTIEGQLRVPDGLSFKNNKLSVSIKGTGREFTIENGDYFTNINGKRRRISYSSEKKEWTKTHRYIKTSGDNVSFPHHIGKLLSGSIDKKTLISISQNQHDIYTLTSKESAESFHAIKIGDNFYRYIPANKKNMSLSGVIKTDNADIKVTRFDKNYFIVNEKKKLSVNYSPCRLGRSPGSSCLHLSDGLISKLKENRRNGIPERKLQGFKPSENNPGLYESAKGGLYLKYDDAYFKLISLEGGVADSQFMVTGKKIFGSKEITPVCLSRERGFNYINTPQENMMESAGMSKTEAVSHIEASPGGEIKEKVNRHNGLVSSSSNEVFKDSNINSSRGLYIREDTKLNEAWSLKGVNVKNKNFSNNNSVGSSIDVTFTIHYNKSKNNRYIDMPPLQWMEKIDLKEGDSKWHFQTDMYNHNPKSMTFFPWVNRYIEAYNFAKAKDKTLFNGNVRIYKNNMLPVDVNDIKSASTPVEKVRSIQNFLSKNGGFMEITITDVPQILKRETANIKERKLTFDIGFNNKVVTHFNQGIYLDTSGETNVFVTTSDNIKLARGDANIQPPEIVTKPREHHFSPGEVY